MPNIPQLTSDDAKIDWLLDQAATNEGLAPLDIESFWADNAAAHADPFGQDIPQVPMGIKMGYEAIFDELGIEEDHYRYHHDADWRLEITRAGNDKAQRIVGRRLLDETPAGDERLSPRIGRLEDIFEAKQEWHDQSWWLCKAAETPEELAALLDRVEARLDDPQALRAIILPPNWDACKQALVEHGRPLPIYKWQRGPVTFACSIYGPENLIFLLVDQPKLAERLRDAILRAILAIRSLLEQEAASVGQQQPSGFGFADDNCYLLNPQMYEQFGYPILKGVFEAVSPNPGDRRYQHSDSNMAHLLPLLSRLNLTGCNFGPTLSVREIRQAMPTTRIDGQLAPFTFSRDNRRGMLEEFFRDYRQAQPQRGLNFATAGSVNNGSRLAGMRLILSAIQHFGRWDD
jgi:uroporphyrinogen decarboxylase